MRHRLPLVDRPTEPRPAPRERRFLPGTIGVADTGNGDAAARFALALAAQLRIEGVAVQLSLTAFSLAPAIPAALAEAFAAADLAPSLHAIDDALPLPWAEAPPPDEVRVLAGLPAVVAFAPALALLIDADRPPTMWPGPLYALRGTYHLTLCAPRPALPARLASTLLESGFLLRR